MGFQRFSCEEDLLRVQEAVSLLRTHHLERLDTVHEGGVVQLIYQRIARHT